MKILRWLLFPFSQLYVLVMAIRNFMFDIGFLEQKQYPVQIISVGNLSTGGTGKTPFIEHLIELIPEEKKVAVLSRGYGRRTKGFVLADEHATAESIGDEPFQIVKKYGDQVLVAVAEKRRVGVEHLLGLEHKPEIILLDDGFQHRWVKRDLNILLTSYDQPFFNDLTLPTGNLRETRFEAKRADMVVVTKCPQLYPSDKEHYEKQIKGLAGDVALLFSTIAYGEVAYAFGQKKLSNKEVIILAGIANPNPFIKFLDKQYQIQDQLIFSDHHAFTVLELDKLNVKLSENSFPIITTEKDMVRLLMFKEHDLFKQHELFYLPISMKIDNEELLSRQVMKHF